MSLIESLATRCNNTCELCGSSSELSGYELPESLDHDALVALCSTCKPDIESGNINGEHWRCLNDSMWSPVPAVQVLAWRLLKKLNTDWSRDALDMLYLDEETQIWAEAGLSAEADQVVHKDSNGAVLAAGDSVVVIKDLNVKGTSFVAKRGTTVRGISLTDNPEHIEGRVNGTRIVILTKFVKKA